MFAIASGTGAPSAVPMSSLGGQPSAVGGKGDTLMRVPLLQGSASDTADMKFAVVVQEVEEEIDALHALANHCLVHEHPHSNCYWLSKYATLTLAALSSGLMYIKPSFKYADRFNDEDNFLGIHSKGLGWKQAICNFIAATLVTLNVSLIFINYLQRRHEMSRGLAAFVAKANVLREKLTNIFIGFGAGVSALPLTAGALQYCNSLEERIVAGIVITFDYSLIHTLPMKILTENPILKRVLVLPLFHDLYKVIRRHCLSDEDLFKEMLAEQVEADHQQLRTALKTPLAAACRQIFHHAYEFKLKSFAYEIKFQEELKTGLTQSKGFDRHLAVLRHAASLPPRQLVTPSPQPATLLGKCWGGLSKGFNWIMRGLPAVVGEVFVPTSVAGFMLSMNNQLEDAPSGWSEPAYALTGFSAYIMAILCGYFGGKTFQGIWDFYVAWRRNDHDMPLAINHYTKTILLLSVLGVYVAYYSSGPATELVYSNLKGEKWEKLREFLAQCAYWGVSIYCGVNMFEIICNAAVSYAIRLGNANEKFAAELAERIPYMLEGIDYVDGSRLEESLVKLPNEQRQQLLGGMEKEKFDGLINHRANLEKKLSQAELARFARFLNGAQDPAAVTVQPAPTGLPQHGESKSASATLVQR